MKGWGPSTIENYGDDVIAILLTPESEIPQGKTVEIVPGIENRGKFWTVEDDIQLLELFVSEYDPVEISTEMKRTEGSVRCRIQQHIEDTLPQERKDELDQYELDEIKSVLLVMKNDNVVVYKIKPKAGVKVKPLSRVILNEKQQIAYDHILKGTSIFLSGEAGTGKTEVIKKLNYEFGSSKKIALTSTTGTSALLMGGVTLHSYLGIGLGDGTANWLAGGIMRVKYLKKRWIDLDILVIDEISMMNSELFDKLDQVGRIVRGSESPRLADKPWGGIQLLLSGDFLQLPVVGSSVFTFEALSWNDSIEKTVVLTENVRQQEDETWRKILGEIRVGKVSTTTTSELNQRVDKEVGVDGIIPTKILSHNMQVDIVNCSALDGLALANPTLEFSEYNMSVTKVISKKVNDGKIEQIKRKSIAPVDLQLCVGAQVMLIVNKMDIGLVNGSRGVVCGFSEDDGLPLVKFVNNVTIKIEEHDFNVTDSSGLKVEFVLRQIPLKIAYAISIHKSQGITLDCAEIDIRSCFCPGQAYVALSRVKSLDGLSLIGCFDPTSVTAEKKCVDFYNEKF